jgi:plasmid stabilization system protein ParE
VTARVRFEDEADAEYQAAGRWYEGHRTGLGIEFLDAVDAAVRQIADLPHAGTRLPRVPATLPVRRVPVRRFPYHVVYLETPVAIRVLAVAHDRRRPGYWKSRLR